MFNGTLLHHMGAFYIGKKHLLEKYTNAIKMLTCTAGTYDLSAVPMSSYKNYSYSSYFCEFLVEFVSIAFSIFYPLAFT